MHACLPACLNACWHACFLRAGMHACLHACVLARALACMFAGTRSALSCLLAFYTYVCMCLVSDMIHIYYIYTHIRSHFGSITILLELVVVAPALASFQSCMGSMEGSLSMSENHDLSNKDSEEDPVEEKKLNPYEKEWKEAQEMQKLLIDTKHRAEGELQEEHFTGFKTIPKTIRTMLQNDIHFLHVAFVRLYFDLEAPGGPITELWKLKEDMCKAQEVLKTAEDHIAQAYLYKNNTRTVDSPDIVI